MSKTSPIGIFDSGVGGLSVLRHIHQQLPHESLLYIADTAYAPYGQRPVSEIRERCRGIADYFIAHGAKAIVVACNTATAAAIEDLRATVNIPVIGMEPGLKPALQQTRSGKVAVLATDNTLASHRFDALIKRYQTNQHVIIQPFTELVSLIETGLFKSKEIKQALEHVIPPLINDGVDTLVLGCSHYPLIIEQIREVAGPDVLVIDTGEAVARETARQLQGVQQEVSGNDMEISLLTSSSNAQARQTLKEIFPGANRIESIHLLTEPA